MNKLKICPVCRKGNLINVRDIELSFKKKFIAAKGERCNFCREEFPYEEEAQRIFDIQK